MAGKSKAGVLKVVLKDGQIHAELHQSAMQSSVLQLNIALLGMGIESDIEAGENRGKHARHEFVVLSHQQYASTSARWQVPGPDYQGQDVPGFALAAWVNVEGDPAPIQAVGGPVPPGFVQ